MYKLQSVHPKRNEKQITVEGSKLCMPQTGGNAFRNVKRIKTILSML